jgi:hypothetical protein
MVIFTAASCLRPSIADFPGYASVGALLSITFKNICQLSMPSTARPGIAELGKCIVRRDS